MVAGCGRREKTRIFAGARKMQKENDVKQNEKSDYCNGFFVIWGIVRMRIWEKNTITAASKAGKKMPKRIIEAFEGREK